MQKSRLLYVVGALLLGALILSIPAGAQAYPNPPSQPASGGEDATIADMALIVAAVEAGTTNFVVQRFAITDSTPPLLNPLPTEIEWICVRKEGGSTLPDRYIQQIKLYLDNVAVGTLDLPGDPLLGVIRNPNLTNGVCFGQLLRLLASVAGGTTVNFLVVADFGMESPDLLTLRLVAEAVPSNGLIGGADVSNSFISAGDYALGDFVTISNTLLNGGAQLVVEQNDVEVAPGTGNVLLGHFDVQDLGGDVRDLCVQHFTAILTGTRGIAANINVLQGLKSLAVYVESGSTPPGFQPTDRLIGMIASPFLVGERITMGGEAKLLLVLGRRNRILMRLPDGQIERLYVVGNLGTEFKDGDQIKLEVIAGARDYAGANCSSGFDIDPSNPVDAYNPVFIRSLPPTMVIGEAFVNSKAKLRISLENIPAPGLAGLEVTFTYDATVADVVNVRGLGPYQVDDWLLGSNELEVTVSLKPTRQPLTGDFDLLEIEFVADSTATLGERTEIDVEPSSLTVMLYDSSEINLDVDPGFVEKRLIRGDVDGDGVVTRRDANLLARWLVGKVTTLTATQKQAGDADSSCPDTTNWTALAPGGCVNATDVRLIRQAAAGMISLGAELTRLTVGELGGVTLLVARESAGAVLFSALNAKNLNVQVFNLSGRTVFAEQTTTGTLRFDGLASDGRALANGVYLYVVTVVTEDGRSFRTEVRKLLLQR